MTSSTQSVLSNEPEAARWQPIENISRGNQSFTQHQTSGPHISMPSRLSGDPQSLGLAPQTVSPNATQLCDDEAMPGDASRHGDNQRYGPQQPSDPGPVEVASGETMDSSQPAVVKQIEATKPSSSPRPSGVNCALSDSGGPVHNQDEEKTTPRPRISESLGLWTCTIIAGGTVITLAVLSFLVFLWAGEGPPGGEGATHVWRTIMLSESWSAQTITICALVVRTVAVAQAALCTSLVAALLLERRQLPLSKVVPLSIMRAVNNGPFSFVREVLSQRYLQPLCNVEMSLLLLVTVVTFGTQFTSTLLLSGFNTTTLVQFPQQLHHKVMFSAEAALNVSKINSFSQFPSSYALFGELETSNSPDPDPRGVSDTGVKLRSFVPFQEQQRLKLRSYIGPAFYQGIQVMCMRPDMDALISWDKLITERGSILFASVSGTISYQKTFEEADLNDWALCSSFQRLDKSNQTVCLPQNFSCTIPLRDTLNTGPLPMPLLALCHLPASMVWNTNQASPAEHTQMWNASNSLWSASANSWVYLTLSTDLTTDAVDKEFMSHKNPSVPLLTPIGNDGEWQTYHILPNMALNVSLCFAGLRTGLYNVSMSTVTDPKEPEVRWDPIYNEDGAEPGQVFMGTTGSYLSAAERGILSITGFRDTDGLEAEDISASSNTLWKGPSTFTGMFSDSKGGSYITCNFCDFAGWTIPPDIAALFTRTIHTTGRAGWAIQSFLTTYTESWYAQILPQFDVAADIEVTFSTQRRIPRHWGGLFAALVMAMVNLVCVWGITVLYVVHTRYSRQGNVWHTVSQIVSEDTRLILEQSNQVLDMEVEKRLKVDDYLVFIGRCKGSDKVSVLRS